MSFEGKETVFSAQKLMLGEDGVIVGIGNSMTPILKSGQPVHVVPMTPETILRKDDIVFCKVGGNYYLHKIISEKNKRYQIGNNHGHINGWVGISNIYGVVDKIL